nr:hypothetical protein Iba_chr04dCG14180 [Ipomoea batatas]
MAQIGGVPGQNGDDSEFVDPWVVTWLPGRTSTSPPERYRPENISYKDPEHFRSSQRIPGLADTPVDEELRFCYCDLRDPTAVASFLADGGVQSGDKHIILTSNFIGRYGRWSNKFANQNGG